MSHVWMGHVTRINGSCHTYEWVKSHVSMSHVSGGDFTPQNLALVACIRVGLSSRAWYPCLCRWSPPLYIWVCVVCCSALQCIAIRMCMCFVFQCVPVYCNVYSSRAWYPCLCRWSLPLYVWVCVVCCSVLQCISMCWSPAFASGSLVVHDILVSVDGLSPSIYEYV